MSPSQRTLAREGRLEGIGLHTGKPSSVRFRPAPVDSGLRFFKEGKPALGHSQDAMRCSAIGEGQARILTVEHLLAAVAGLGITNLDIDVDGPEVPGLDGSALPFVRSFQGLGIVEQAKPAEVYRVREPLFCYDDKKAIAVFPSDSFSVSYLLDYDHPHLRQQKVDVDLAGGVFESEIAPARTFCTESEAQKLRAAGLGLGCTRENTVVVAEDGSHRAGLRFPDECARHKVLDVLGDLQLLGFALAGRVVAVRSGHALNRRLVEAIRQQKEDYN
jgi:UDP-3-O-acyl N-acetylglucosamine deacetylase